VLFESWLLLQAADLAEHVATQLAVAVTGVQHEAHVLLEEITQGPAGFFEGNSVNGGCSET
jgi:hypothetical protein